jgi:hypothetical protein
MRQSLRQSVYSELLELFQGQRLAMRRRIVIVLAVVSLFDSIDVGALIAQSSRGSASAADPARVVHSARARV